MRTFLTLKYNHKYSCQKLDNREVEKSNKKKLNKKYNIYKLREETYLLNYFYKYHILNENNEASIILHLRTILNPPIFW